MDSGPRTRKVLLCLVEQGIHKGLCPQASKAGGQDPCRVLEAGAHLTGRVKWRDDLEGGGPDIPPASYVDQVIGAARILSVDKVPIMTDMSG